MSRKRRREGGVFVDIVTPASYIETTKSRPWIWQGPRVQEGCMERIKAFCLAGIGLLVWSVAGCASWNAFQRAGDLQMAGLGAAVEVLRDEKGMAYIHAANDDDLLRAQAS
jgi:hypothetical protein